MRSSEREDYSLHGQTSSAFFEAFTQVRVRDGRPEGTGLGLAVSSRLAALLGGELTVQSDLGRGSAFTLTLPAVPRPAGQD
ncbi:MAG: hypothetical protein CVT66_09140 [Actinobacteria bacterium HGW-Actinobacteria-6]|nr:MAG: hypothetical protein CVT66_09140 [Actinobacteria bacterium HGW-Actinobacteria-6]